MLVASITFAFHFLFHLKAISHAQNILELQNPPCEKYMKSEDVAIVKNCKKHFAQMNGLNLTDSDISGCLGNNQLVDSSTAQRLSHTCLDSVSRKKRGVAIIFQNPGQKWPNTIFYVFSLSSLTVANVEGVKNTIRSTLSYIQSQTCLKFVEGPPPSNSQPYMRFEQDVSCLSFIGKVLTGPENKILINEACWNSVGSMLNLISQSLGLFVEIQRPDRDNYVTVQYGNIPKERQSDFSTYSSNFATTMGSGYDYSSIMHPPPKWFSSNNQITLQTKTVLMQNTIGQRVEYSFPDTQILNNIYCQGYCGLFSSPQCQNGGYQDPAFCSLCKCPDGFGGNDCSSYGKHDSKCGSQVIRLDAGGSGIIRSPGYSSPGYYDKGTACTWSIKGPVGSRLVLNFVGDFNVYCDNMACNHWVEIRYKRPLHSLGPRMCCNSVPVSTLVSDDNEVLILFRTIDSTPTSNFRGFQLQYSIETAPCVPTFVKRSNTNSPGGVLNSSYRNLADCQQYCASLDSCVAIDWDRSGSSCWVHQAAENLGSIRDSTSIDQYVINRSCDPATTNYVTSTTARTTTATTTNVASTRPGDCFLWTVTINTSSPGATLAGGVTTIESCRASCQQNPTCLAVDFDTNTSPSSCWIHTSPDALVTQTFSSNVQQHRVSRGCSSSRPSTATGSGCPTWSSRVNSNSPGGTKLAAVTTVDSCKQSCVDDPRCVAVDFDSRPETQSCWAHFASSNLITLLQTGGVTQHLLIARCPSTDNTAPSAATAVPTATVPMTAASTTTEIRPSTRTSTQTTTPPTTSSTTSTTTTTTTFSTRTASTTTPPTTALKCPFFNTFTNTNSPGGVGYDQYPSEEACRDFCASNSSCLAVDFNSLDRSCWAHYDATNLRTRREYSGVKQFVLLQRCPPSVVPEDATITFPQCPSWIGRSGHSVGANFVSGVSTVSGCQAICIATPECVAIDFNLADSSCWWHNAAKNLSSLIPDDTVMHYKLTRCDQDQSANPITNPDTTTVIRLTDAVTTFPVTTTTPTVYNDTVCETQFQLREDASGYGASQVIGVNWEQACKDKCLANERCIAFDFNTLSSTCWMYTDPKTTSLMYHNRGVRHFTVTYRCNQPPPCEPKWIIRYGAHAMGAQRHPQTLSPSECVAYCLDTSTCAGVDVDVSQSQVICWVHSSIQNFAQLYSNPAVTQYQLSSRCTSDTPDGCTPGWIIRNGTQSMGARKSSTPLLLFDCLNLCASNPRCVAVDSNVILNPPECWIYEDSSKLVSKYAHPDVNQYEITSRCPPNTAPRDTGSCGGKSARPGQFYPPCMLPRSPPSSCNTYTLQINGFGFAQWINSAGPCMKPVCSLGSELVNYLGEMKCVAPGWGDWSPCNVKCGYGLKKRFRYLANIFSYFVHDQDSQTCYVAC